MVCLDLGFFFIKHCLYSLDKLPRVIFFVQQLLTTLFSARKSLTIYLAHDSSKRDLCRTLQAADYINLYRVVWAETI